MQEVKPRRSYRSAVRDDAARRTRRTIVEAAGRLFVERGYSATSLQDIGTSAGVARPTVFAAFGSKAAVLRQVVDEALAGDDEPVPVAERPWFRPVWDAPDQAGVLAAYAVVCSLIGQRVSDVFEVARQASDESAELRDLWATLVDNRHRGAEMVARRVRELGPLPTGVTIGAATDTVWIFNDPALYAALVGQRRWSQRAYTQWLARQLRSGVLRR